MLVYDEDLDEMVEDYRKWYECPKCNMDWTNEDCEDDDFEALPKDEELKGVTVLNIDDGKEIEYRKYVEKLCPDCSEKTIDGRRKGPLVEQDLEGKELDYDDFRCQVCGSKELVFKPGRSPEKGTLICDSCNSHNFIRMDNYPYDQDITRLSYREDLQTKEFNENFEEMTKIILESKPIEIK
jgi:transcription elongation factor Elf1